MDHALSHATPSRLRVPSILWLALVPLIFAYVIYWNDATDMSRAIFWHLTHGNHASYQGHTFRLPLLWRPVEVERGISLRRSIGVQINVDSAISGTLTEANALGFQKSTAESLTKGSLNTRFVPETIHAANLTFLCVREEANKPSSLYICFVPGTDWEVGVTGTNSNLDDIRPILASAQ